MNSDDGAVGYEQARQLRTTMVAADIDRGHLWLYYFSIGGDVSEFEVDAYLHHCLTLPQLQRDLMAHAANEILADLAPPKAPYAAELIEGRTTSAGNSTAQDESAPVQGRDVMDNDNPGTTENKGRHSTHRTRPSASGVPPRTDKKEKS